MPIVEPVRLQLKFLGAPLGVLAYRADVPAYALELDATFLAAGHDLSPLNLPLESFTTGLRLFRPGDTPFTGGLPGLIADSLPDAWGERMLRHEVPGLQTALGKLAAIGQRGPGAITFEPVIGPGADRETSTAQLAELAREAEALRSSPTLLTNDHVNAALIHGGSSLGGAFPKISAHLPLAGKMIKRQEILVGGATPRGYVPCILKFARSTDEVEAATLGGWSKAAREASVPKAMIQYWEKEMIQQTRALRTDANGLKARRSSRHRF